MSFDVFLVQEKGSDLDICLYDISLMLCLFMFFLDPQILSLSRRSKYKLRGIQSVLFQAS